MKARIILENAEGCELDTAEIEISADGVFEAAELPKEFTAWMLSVGDTLRIVEVK